MSYRLQTRKPGLSWWQADSEARRGQRGQSEHCCLCRAKLLGGERRGETAHVMHTSHPVVGCRGAKPGLGHVKVQEDAEEVFPVGRCCGRGRRAPSVWGVADGELNGGS